MVPTDKSEMLFEPLVSIIVMTYNSAKYVLETLESTRSTDLSQSGTHSH